MLGTLGDGYLEWRGSMTWLRTRVRRVRPLKVAYRGLRRWLGMDCIQEFAIGIYHGDQPWTVRPALREQAPVLTRDHVSDVPAAFVADPFMIRHDDRWFMFFEVMRADTWRGEIAVATSCDGITWAYGQVVLAEGFHLSYPYVFEWDGDMYMIPETYEARSVRLYRAASFPSTWVLERELLAGASYADASVFRHKDHWWMFVETSHRHPDMAVPPGEDTLRLFGAPALVGPWTEHPNSPVVAGDARIARPAGRVVVSEAKLVRFAQECVDTYGVRVHARQIEELTPTTYRERRLTDHPVLGPGHLGWNNGGMHHIDAHRVGAAWIASVDGWSWKAPALARSAPQWIGSIARWLMTVRPCGREN